jgi:lipoyl synthase
MIKTKKERLRLPEWFKKSKGKRKATQELSRLLEAEVPNSICQEAKCPNRSDCFSKGILTFMILGTICTRNCAFCSVAHGKPLPPDKSEVDNILSAIVKLNLRFVVLTSPNRDDLPDEGSMHYNYIVSEIKKHYPAVRVEVLIPDFKGKALPLFNVLEANPDVLNHNIETVPSLYTTARRGSLFQRSLDVLKSAKKTHPKVLTKSGVMVGLGETKEELIETFKALYNAQVDILTLGQYLKPSRDNLDVVKYYHPDEFKELQEIAEGIGFRYVFSGPLVRSSYLAENVFEDTKESMPNELALS